MLHGLHGVSGKSPKDEAEFCQVPPVVAVLVKQLLLPLLEQLDGLLALPLQVLDEDLEVLVRVQQVQLVLQITPLKSAKYLQIKKSKMFLLRVFKCEAIALLCDSW